VQPDDDTRIRCCSAVQARLLFTLQLRLRSQRGKLGDFYAWNACLSHILALAQVRSCQLSIAVEIFIRLSSR
jgi:hypothetical protein